MVLDDAENDGRLDSERLWLAPGGNSSEKANVAAKAEAARRNGEIPNCVSAPTNNVVATLTAGMPATSQMRSAGAASSGVSVCNARYMPV